MTFEELDMKDKELKELEPIGDDVRVGEIIDAIDFDYYTLGFGRTLGKKNKDLLKVIYKNYCWYMTCKVVEERHYFTDYDEEEENENYFIDEVEKKICHINVSDLESKLLTMGYMPTERKGNIITYENQIDKEDKVVVWFDIAKQEINFKETTSKVVNKIIEETRKALGK